MAIDIAYFHYLAPILREMKKSEGCRVACLSYPDILMTPEEVAPHFHGLDIRSLKVRPDSEEICRWHGIQTKIQITDTKSLFEELGLKIDFFDVQRFRGEEIIVDLNVELDQSYFGKYDLVLDTGTLEHCFNVGVAFLNMCNLVSAGGSLLTQAPMTKANHGFWNFSPCAYENFFNQNQWELRFIEGYFKDKGDLKRFIPPSNARFVPPFESILIANAKRGELKKMTFPTQLKYLGPSPKPT
jgi:hypothetical protein